MWKKNIAAKNEWSIKLWFSWNFHCSGLLWFFFYAGEEQGVLLIWITTSFLVWIHTVNNKRPAILILFFFCSSYVIRVRDGLMGSRWSRKSDKKIICMHQHFRFVIEITCGLIFLQRTFFPMVGDEPHTVRSNYIWIDYLKRVPVSCRRTLKFRKWMRDKEGAENEQQSTFSNQ